MGDAWDGRGSEAGQDEPKSQRASDQNGALVRPSGTQIGNGESDVRWENDVGGRGDKIEMLMNDDFDEAIFEVDGAYVQKVAGQAGTERCVARISRTCPFFVSRVPPPPLSPPTRPLPRSP